MNFEKTVSIDPIEVFSYPNPILRQQTREVTAEDLTNEFLLKVSRMFRVLQDKTGAGISSTQVGDNRRFFLIGIPDIIEPKRKKGRVTDRKIEINKYEICINPAIIEESTEDIAINEECLSVSGVSGVPVYRPQRIWVRYFNLRLEPIELELVGWASRVFQHELDHLNGKLFIDRLSLEARKSISPKIRSLRLEWENRKEGEQNAS